MCATAAPADYHDDGRSRPHNLPVHSSRNTSPLTTVYIYRNIPKQLRNTKAHILEVSNTYALAIIYSLTASISITELLTESINHNCYLQHCLSLHYRPLGREVNSNFSSSGCLINLYTNNLFINFF